MVTLGWKAGDELLDFAVAAEQAGFESIDVSDHFASWSEVGQASFAWTWLGAVAARTTTIQLGTGVTCPVLRYHPAIIAQAAATLEYLAPGRVYLCVGTGEALNEYAASGRWPGYTERRERLGKDASRMPKLIELNVAYTDDEPAAIACMKQYWAGTFLPALFDRKIYTPCESATNGAGVIKQKMCLSADPEEHVRYAWQHIDRASRTSTTTAPGPISGGSSRSTGGMC